MNPRVTIIVKPTPTPQDSNGQLATTRTEAQETLFTSLAGLLATDAHATIALEVMASNGHVWLQVNAPASWQTQLEAALYAAFPAADLDATPQNKPALGASLAAATIQFSPPDEPLREISPDGPDPLRSLFEICSSIAEAGDQMRLQLLLTSPKDELSLAARALHGFGDAMLFETKKLVLGTDTSNALQKVPPDKPKDKSDTAPLRANLRLVIHAANEKRAQALARGAAGAYHVFSSTGQAVARYHLERKPQQTKSSLQNYQPDPKTAFLLTATEAAHLYHPPHSPRDFPRLSAQSATRLPIPPNLPRAGLFIGRGAYRDAHPAIHLTPADRLRHTYIIGATGSGKSTLLQTAILQDMQNGDGCCFIDPHGEVIDWLLPRIPPERAGDVVLFDPSDHEALLGLNLLEWHTNEERDLLIQELIALFYKLFDPGRTGIIGPQFEHWLRCAALTITEPAVRGTLIDIPRLFTDPDFQKAIVARAEHPAVKDFWLGQMARTADFHKSEMLNYFTSKFGSFLGNAVMRDILSARASAFDLRTLMDRRKILLVNLSKGKLGSLNAQLLGTLIVTKLQLAALSRANASSNERPPFYVYIDEFQNVVTDSFATMLSEIRKYGVGLHLAHQYVDQLPETVKTAVLGNVGTLMAFRLGTGDASWLADHFAPLSPEDLTGVAPYHYHLRMLVHGGLTQAFTVAAPNVTPEPNAAIERVLRNRVRQFVAATATS